MYHGGAIDMGSFQIVLSIDQKRLQKRLIPGLDQLSHFRHLGVCVCLGPEFRPITMFAMQSSAGLGLVPSSSQSTT